MPNVSCLTNNCVAFAENLAENSDTWTFFKWNSTNERADPSFALNAASATQLQTCFMPGADDSQRTTSAYQKRPIESDPATWVSFVWKLSDEAPEVCGYDLACRFCKYSRTPHTDANAYKDSNGAGQLTSWALAGSVDGFAWDELSAVSTNEHCFTAHTYWFFSPSLQASDKDLTTVHPTTGPIASRAATKPVVFADGVNISVSAGATLEAIGAGDAVSVKGINIASAQGLGRLNGFTLAEEGTIAFDTLPKGRTTVYSGALAGCEGLANVSGWTVTEGGKATTKVDIAVGSDGTVTVTRHGLILLVK